MIQSRSPALETAEPRRVARFGWEGLAKMAGGLAVAAATTALIAPLSRVPHGLHLLMAGLALLGLGGLYVRQISTSRGRPARFQIRDGILALASAFGVAAIAVYLAASVAAGDIRSGERLGRVSPVPGWEKTALFLCPLHQL